MRLIDGGREQQGTVSVIDDAPASRLVEHLLEDDVVDVRPGRSALRVVAVWDDDRLLEFRDFGRNETVTIGGADDASIRIFHGATALRKMPVFTTNRRGVVTAIIPVEASGELRRGTKRLHVVDLVRDGIGTTVRVPVTGTSVTLRVGDRLLLRFGRIRVVARIVPDRHPKPSPFDAAFFARIVIWALAATTVAAMSAIAEPDDRAGELSGAAFEYTGMRTAARPVDP